MYEVTYAENDKNISQIMKLLVKYTILGRIHNILEHCWGDLLLGNQFRINLESIYGENKNLLNHAWQMIMDHRNRSTNYVDFNGGPS